MKIQLLPSSFDSHGCASPEQRLTCYLIDRRVAIDAGSLAIALADGDRDTVRDVIITHPHMDHIASLPIFIDDLFATLTQPVRIHATAEVIELLERDVFNWTIYPRFSELKNDRGPVMQYVPFREGEEFGVAHLRVTAVGVNHVVPTVGLLISDGKTVVAFGSDTSETDRFWELVNRTPDLDAVMIEASFPNDMQHLANVSHHLTPRTLRQELCKLRHRSPDVLAVHIKPSYRESVVAELEALQIPRLQVMQPGRDYEW